MAQVILPRSLAVLIPNLPHKASVDGDTGAALIAALGSAWPGVADRLVEAGPALRESSQGLGDGGVALSTRHLLEDLGLAGGEAVEVGPMPRRTSGAQCCHDLGVDH